MLELMILRYQALRTNAELLDVTEEIELIGLSEILMDFGMTSL